MGWKLMGIVCVLMKYRGLLNLIIYCELAKEDF